MVLWRVLESTKDLIVVSYVSSRGFEIVGDFVGAVQRWIGGFPII